MSVSPNAIGAIRNSNARGCPRRACRIFPRLSEKGSGDNHDVAIAFREAK